MSPGSASALACAGVELGHELAVGCSCRGEVVVAFFDLEAEVDGLVLEMGDFPGERVDVGGGAEPGFPPCLLAEGLGEPFLELLYAGGQAGCALVGGEQVCLQRFPCDGRAGRGSGCGRGGFEGVDLGEEVTVPVEEGAVDVRGACDGGDADLGAVGGCLADRGDDALTPAGGVGLASFSHGIVARACRGHGHVRAWYPAAGGRVPGMPRLTARCLRMTVTASSMRARPSAGSPAMSPLIRLMRRRIRVISSSAGVASARAQSSTPLMAAARRSRVRSRSSR